MSWDLRDWAGITFESEERDRRAAAAREDDERDAREREEAAPTWRAALAPETARAIEDARERLLRDARAAQNETRLGPWSALSRTIWNGKRQDKGDR